jgi:GT2 family glycosyltransferase
MDASIIIVNWNSAGCVKQCLASIYKNTNNLAFEIIVVDNASYDGCKEMLQNEFQNALYVQSEKNVGFAAANNLGFQYASGKSILLLNPDTEIIGNAIYLMYKHLNSLTDAGAIGCKLLNSDLSLQTSCVQAFPSLLTHALDSEMSRRFFPKLKIWGMRPLLINHQAPVEVDVISGACLMAKRDVFEKAGLLSTDYFMYAEDVDLCYKIRQKGYKVYYTDAAAVVHHGGQSTQKTTGNFESVILLRESTAKFFKKTRGKPYAKLYKISMAMVALVRLTLIFGAGFFAKSDPANRLQNFSFHKWKLILLWSLGFAGVDRN